MTHRFKHTLCAALLSALMVCGVQATPVHFAYDARDEARKPTELFICGNWNFATGTYEPGWNEFKRFPMYDDGQHHDGEADDGIWGLRVEILPGDHLYEWALDSDADTGNGWMGTGPSFTVGREPLTVHYRLPLAELGKRFGVDMSKAGPPAMDKAASAVLLRYRARPGEQVHVAGTMNNWAENDQGAIRGHKGLMQQGPHDLWFEVVSRPPADFRYKFVVRNAAGEFDWKPDPTVPERDDDGNTVLDLASLKREAQRRTAETAAPADRELDPTQLERIGERFGVEPAQAGPPALSKDGSAVLLRYRARPGVEVYLAGTMNNWANNDNGVIRDERFRMLPGPNQLWLAVIEQPAAILRYKFAEKNAQGEFDWKADPNVPERDDDGNTVLNVEQLKRAAHSAKAITGRPLEPLALRPEGAAPRIEGLELGLERAWLRPGESGHLRVTRPRSGDIRKLRIRITDTLGRERATVEHALSAAPATTTLVEMPPVSVEGPHVYRVAALDAHDRVQARGWTVQPAGRHVADDLRYGFHAEWRETREEYDTAAAALADLHLNAIEYYDYFPAHGNYAPTTTTYKFEPFGIPIDARNVRGKIEAGRRHGLYAIAYVAAYAASRSVFERHPYPLTNREGVPLIFNGSTMTEREADAEGKEKWFWLMAIDRASPWREHIMPELRRTLDDGPGDLVDFDGFEMDTYGHPADMRYYAGDSPASGQLLSDVLARFVADVRDMAREVQRDAVVSFNCVSEFGIEHMYDVTDFLFIENWAGHKSSFQEVVDICYRHRAPRRQRVVIKMYPADAGLDPPVWSPLHLKLTLGATIVGGGSMMIAGEPDASGRVHALNSLFYPDSLPLPDDSRAALKAYNAFDALLMGLNHGPQVENLDAGFWLDGCITRSFRGNDAITVMLLNHGANTFWNRAPERVEPIRRREIAYPLPPGFVPRAVWFASPDRPELALPRKLDFDVREGHARVLLPELAVLGALILQA